MTDEPESLFHYTTEQGLIGILESNTLWATDFRHLNDEKEITVSEEIFRSMFQKTAKKILEDRTSIEGARELQHLTQPQEQELISNIPKLADVLLKPITNNQIFLTCFCKHEDELERKNGKLSMWRSYARPNGFAIEFDYKKIDKLINEAFPSERDIKFFEKVIYFDPEQYELTNTLTPTDLATLEQGAIATLRADFTRSREEEYEPIITDFLTPENIKTLIDITIKLKHKGFKEEDEWRFATFINSQQEDAPIFYEGTNQLDETARYILFDNMGVDISEAIKCIIVAPSKDKKEIAARLERWLHRREKDITVRASSIPFKG